mgnify:FL=1
MTVKPPGRHCEMLTPEYFLQEKQFNIWDCYSEQGSSFNGRLHFHDFYELSVIYEGASRFMVNGSEFTMGVRSLQLIRPMDYHRQLTGDGEHIRYYNLMFAADFISEPLLHALEECSGPLCVTDSTTAWNNIYQLIRKIMEEFTKNPDDSLSKIFIRCNVENLCLFILRHQQNECYTHTETMQEPIRRALSYVQKNYRQSIRLSDVAETARLSPSYFSTLFHTTMGVSFSAYLTGYRLQIAERYLRSSNLSIKQISTVCGFSSYPYFISAFKTLYGIPPGSWRSQTSAAANSLVTR